MRVGGRIMKEEEEEALTVEIPPTSHKIRLLKTDNPPLADEDDDKEPQIMDGLKKDANANKCCEEEEEEEEEEDEEELSSSSNGWNGRDRIQRHRVEVAGNVWIPDTWGQEDLLKGWMDCSTFDSDLVPKGIMSARAALAKQATTLTPHSPRNTIALENPF